MATIAKYCTRSLAFSPRSIEKIASSIRLEDCIPHQYNGRWRKPRLSARRRAVLEKKCMERGLINPFEQYAASSPSPTRRDPYHREPKLHRALRPEIRRAREEMIYKKLKDMPQQVETHHLQKREERRKRNLSEVPLFGDFLSQEEKRFGQALRAQRRKAALSAKKQKKQGVDSKKKQNKEKDGKLVEKKTFLGPPSSSVTSMWDTLE